MTSCDISTGCGQAGDAKAGLYGSGSDESLKLNESEKLDELSDGGGVRT